MTPLISKVIGEALYDGGRPENAQDAEPDLENIERALDHIHRFFVDERVSGYVSRNTGKAVPPVSREEAERRWLEAEPKFRQSLMNYDPKTDQRLATHVSRSGRQAAYANRRGRENDFNWDTAPANIERFGQELDANRPLTRAERAMKDEPSLRRGESLLARVLGNLNE